MFNAFLLHYFREGINTLTYSSLQTRKYFKIRTKVRKTPLFPLNKTVLHELFQIPYMKPGKEF